MLFLKNFFHKLILYVFKYNVFISVISVVLLFILVFSFDIFAVTKWDSAIYLQWSTSLSEIKKIVLFGNKQTGYSFLFYVINLFSNIVNCDFFLFVALFQRILFFCSICFSIYVFGIYFIPIAFLLSLPMFVSITNIFYPEAFSYSLYIFFFAIIFKIIYMIKDKIEKNNDWKIVFYFFCANFIFVALSWVKMQNLIFGLLLLFFIVILKINKKKSLLKKFLIIFVPINVVILILLVNLSLRNNKQFGTYSFITKTTRVKLHHAWLSIYDLGEKGKNVKYSEPINRYIHRVEDDRTVSASRRTEMFENYIDEIFINNNTSRTIEQFKSSLGVLLGGRKNELAPIQNRILTNNGMKKYDPSYLYSWWFKKNKDRDIQTFLKTFNKNKYPSYLNGLTKIKFKIDLPWNLNKKYRYFSAFVLIFILFSFVVFIKSKKLFEILLISISIIIILTNSIALGINFADQWRYVMGSWLLTLFIFIYILKNNIQKKIKNWK